MNKSDGYNLRFSKFAHYGPPYFHMQNGGFYCERSLTLAHSCAYRLMAGSSVRGAAECFARSRLCSSKTASSKGVGLELLLWLVSQPLLGIASGADVGWTICWTTVCCCRWGTWTHPELLKEDWWVTVENCCLEDTSVLDHMPSSLISSKDTTRMNCLQSSYSM